MFCDKLGKKPLLFAFSGLLLSFVFHVSCHLHSALLLIISFPEAADAVE